MTSTATLAPDATGTVIVQFPRVLPNGPWKVELTLRSGMVDQLAARVRELAPGGVDAVFDHLGGASVNLSYRMLNRTGTLVSYSIAAALDGTRPVLLDFLPLLAKLAFWNYLPTRRHASFYDVWAGLGKPGTAKREAFQARMRADLAHVFGLLRDGRLTAKIAARFPLTEVAAAVELVESSGRTALGKVILVP